MAAQVTGVRWGLGAAAAVAVGFFSVARHLDCLSAPP